MEPRINEGSGIPENIHGRTQRPIHYDSITLKSFSDEISVMYARSKAWIEHTSIGDVALLPQSRELMISRLRATSLLLGSRETSYHPEVKKRIRLSQAIKDQYDISGSCEVEQSGNTSVSNSTNLAVGIRIPESLTWVSVYAFDASMNWVDIPTWVGDLFKELHKDEGGIRIQDTYDLAYFGGSNPFKAHWEINKNYLQIALSNGQKTGFHQPGGARPIEVVVNDIPYEVDVTAEGVIDLTNSRLLFSLLQRHTGSIQVILDS
jgi:hypothetical protein